MSAVHIQAQRRAVSGKADFSEFELARTRLDAPCRIAAWEVSPMQHGAEFAKMIQLMRWRFHARMSKARRHGGGGCSQLLSVPDSSWRTEQYCPDLSKHSSTLDGWWRTGRNEASGASSCYARPLMKPEWSGLGNRCARSGTSQRPFALEAGSIARHAFCRVPGPSETEMILSRSTSFNAGDAQHRRV
jgi:hypothetical protein